MSLPPPSFHSLDELARRWDVTPFEIVGWSAEGLIALSVLLPPVRLEGCAMFSGLADLEPAHILPLFRQDAAPGASVAIRWFRSGDGGGLQRIEEPADGIPTSSGDVLVRHGEFLRFEKRDRKSVV